MNQLFWEVESSNVELRKNFVCSFTCIECNSAVQASVIFNMSDNENPVVHINVNTVCI